MKRLLCFMLTLALIFSSVSVAYAKQGGSHTKKGNTKATVHTTMIKKAKPNEKKQVKAYEKKHVKAYEKKQAKAYEKKQTFKINQSPVIKYGRYKLPIKAVTKGMKATVDFDKSTGVLTVTKNTTVIVINFKDKTVTVNGTADTASGIFTAKNDKRSIVLIKYIADRLGVRLTYCKDKISTEIPKEDNDKDQDEDKNQNYTVSVTPAGVAVVANTLNTTTDYLTATASIPVNKATGGKAELYVGTTLVAVDTAIASTDTSVTFSTSDGTPTNAELQALIPSGGAVTVKLYDALGKLINTITASKPLTVDYAIPAVTSVSSAALSVTGSSLNLSATGAGAIGDKVDVTKLSLYDTALNKTYQLTNTAVTGSTGVVNSDAIITVTLGSADVIGLSGFGTSSVYLYIAPGSLLFDTAGNISTNIPAIQMVPVTVIQ